MSRSTRTLLAVIVFVLAGFIITNLLISGSQLDEWLLPVILLGIGLVLALYPDREAEAEAHTEPHTEAHAALPPTIEPEPVVAAASEPATPAPVAAAPVSTGPDDLTRVEGIGKKMAAALTSAGIDTFAKLAATTEDDLRAAIKAAGMRFAPSIPTWSKQAGFAASDDWDGLQAYQSTLVAGREPDA